MKGYIINLTLRGQARAKAGDGFPAVPGKRSVAVSSRRAPSLRQGRTQRVLGPSVDLTLSPPLLDRLAEVGPNHPRYRQKQPLTIPTSSSNCADLFYEVIRHHSASVPLSEALAMNALERLILRCFQQQPISNRHAHDPRINAICDYLNAHIAQEVKIETLAAMVFISPSRLAHLFKNELGQTVYAWRETQRINRARWLIQSTSLPLNKIALSVGYSDPVYFTRLFRKHNGIPPGEYRKRYAEMKG